MTKRRRNVVNDDSDCGTNGVNDSDDEVQNDEKPRRSRGGKEKVKYYESDEEASMNGNGRKSDKRNGVDDERRSGRRNTQKKKYVENTNSEASDEEENEKTRSKKESKSFKKANKRTDDSSNSSSESANNGKHQRPPRRSRKIASESEEDDPKTNGNSEDYVQENGENGVENEHSSEDNLGKTPDESSTVSNDESEHEENSKQRGREKRMMKKVAEVLEETTGGRRSRKQVKYIEDESESSEEKNAKKSSKKNDSDFIEDENEEEDNEEFISAETTESESPPRKRIKTETDSRRSGRERKVTKQYQVEVPEKKKRKTKKSSSEASAESEEESETESEEEKVKKRKKKKNVGTTKRKPKFKSKKRKRARSYEGSENESSEEEGYEKRYRNRKTDSAKKNQKKRQGTTTGRNRATVSYAVSESDTHTDTPGYVSGSEAEEVEIEGVDQVCDHRQGKVGATGEATKHFAVLEHGDPNETLETTEMEEQYLIKWMGLSHINNSWETQETLDARKKGFIEVKGLRRLVNYQNKLRDYKMWKKRANPEDIEYQEIDIELGRELIKSYKEAERIFSRRKTEENKLEYYVKWKNLPYIEATWEEESLIKKHYSTVFDEFKRRKKSKTDPKDYKEAMKTVKKRFAPMKEQPDYIGSEKFRMRDYQLDGINFLLNAWHKNNSVILADEMGLGKTIQTITFLKYLFHNYSFKGPMLVCVPLSTIAAWQKEFDQWAPDINAITYIGDAKSREVIRDFECENEHGEITFNVIMTSYEMVCKDRNFFEDIVWSNVVVDEAHRLKSDDSLLYQVLTQMDSHHRLLLTGTPLQNNLKELWCLLNFLRLPEIDDWPSFEEDYGTPEDRASGYVKLHSLLKPYIIRRLKKDVEKSLPPKVEQILRVDMTIRQKKLYKLVLTKNYQSLSKCKNQVSLLNIMMQLRKTCNHAELIQEVDLNHQQTAEERLQQIIYGSGKMLLLDKLLTRFKEKGDRVLIFSQMVIMLNIMEEYLELKRYPYQRLDGSVSSDKRKQAIAAFNNQGSPDFCFLLSTKAGGLGINLQTANRVIIFDSDFNPQNDLQAIARAHRIGQKEEVKIFRLVASSSVDEDIIQRAKNKMVLDHLVIQNMDTTGKTVVSGKKGKNNEAAFSKDELNTIIKFGAADLFKENEDGTEEQDKEVDLDAILEKAELREEEEAPQSEANKELLSAFKCTTLTFEETEQDMDKDENKSSNWEDIIPSNMRDEHKPKQDFEGLELYSDNEDLYNPIANRRKARTKKVTKSIHVDSDGDGDKGSDYKQSDSDSDGSDVSEGTKNARELEKEKVKKKINEIRSLKCLICDKRWGNRRNLKRHMVEVHKQLEFLITPEHYTNLPEIKSEKNFCVFCNKGFPDKLSYQLHINNIHGGIEPEVNYDEEKMKEFMKAKAPPPKKQLKVIRNMVCLECGKGYVDAPALRRHMKEVHKAENFVAAEENYVSLPEIKSGTYRCFPCSKSFNVLGYKLHIKHKHQSTEPPENYDPVKLAHYENLTKMMICLVCETRLGDPYALKRHMMEAHCMENFEIQDDNYYNLPTVQSTKNLCVPCSRLFAKSVLYRLHIKNKHGGLEPEQNINPALPVGMSQAASEAMKNVPASLKIKLVQPQAKPQTERNWMCAQCKKCFKDQKFLRKHMQDVHKLEPLSLTQSDYLELPNVESTLNRCLPCNKTFPNSLRYRIHIKDVHDKKEPAENYDAENCAQPEDFICIICVKKFVSRKSLRNHIYKTHLGLNPDDEKGDKSQENQENKSSAVDETPAKENKEEQDPLADPLDIDEQKPEPEESSTNKDLATRTENESCVEVSKEDEKTEAEEESKFDEPPKIQTVDIKSITTTSDDVKKTIVQHVKDMEKENAEPMNIDTDIKQDVCENMIEKDLSESKENKDDAGNNVDITSNEENPKPAEVSEEKLKPTGENDEVQRTSDTIVDNKGEEEIVILETPKASGPAKVLSEKEKKLIDKMLNMLKKYGCAFCSNRFDTKYALSYHERTHLKEKKSPKKEQKKVKLMPTPKKVKEGEDADGSPETPKVKKSTKMGSVQLHDNVSGPVCFKCSVVCKDNSNYKNHILSHYYREFDPHIPQTKPFECPICAKPSRDKITLIRHYAFTHQKMFELTDITPEQLIPPGSTPKTPRARPNKSMVESTDDMMTPKVAPTSPAIAGSPMETENDDRNEEPSVVQSNGLEGQGKTEVDVNDISMEEDHVKGEKEEKTDSEIKLEENTVADKVEDEKPLETDNNINQEESIPDQEIFDGSSNTEVKAPLDTEIKECMESDPSANKENEKEVL